MKKILYVTNITRTVNTFFIPHMNMLVENKNEVECACKIKGEHKLEKERINPKIKFHHVPFTRNIFDVRNIIAFYRLCKLQKAYNYDIIHVHTPIVAMYTRLLKIFYKNVKIIYTAHGYHFYKGASKFKWLIFYNIEKYLSKYTDILITINNEDYKISSDFKCKKLIKMNGVGVDFSQFKELSREEKLRIRESLDLGEDDFILIMVGEHNKNKNQMQLIQAIKNIENEYPKIKVLLIGDGKLLRKNELYIEKNNIKNVKILGFRNDVNELINISDTLVSLSYREGLPKNIIEGLACKKPIIGTRIRGTTDLVEQNENGFIVKVNDYKETEEIIKKLYKKSEKELLDFGNVSYKKAQKYNINSVLNELNKIY